MISNLGAFNFLTLILFFVLLAPLLLKLLLAEFVSLLGLVRSQEVV